MSKINSYIRWAFNPRNSLSNPLFLYFFVTIGVSCQSDTTGQHSAATMATSITPPADTAVVGVSNDYLLGKFNPATHPDFVTIAKPYTNKPGMMLRKEAFQAFELMWKAAKKDGVILNIISSTRNFDQQKGIWEGKWTRFEKDAPRPKDRALKILEYSSMPGSSRHHWGTDVDLNDLNNATFEKGGTNEKVYKWLSAHAHEYGFCQPYTAGRPSGYHEEKWHWSYTPLSKGFLETYQKNLSEINISGFKGSETAQEIGIVKNYVLGINKECR